MEVLSDKGEPSRPLTRGISAVQFVNNDLWLRGPHWITKTENWPSWDTLPTAVCTTLLEDCHEHVIETTPATSRPVDVIGIHNVIDVKRFSKLRKLIRITAYVLRFIRNCRLDKSTRRLEPLSVAELNEADHLWIRSSQKTNYSDEIDNIKSQHSRLTLVKQLKLFLDDEGDIRCGGRIHNAPVSEDRPSFRIFFRRKSRTHAYLWRMRTRDCFIPGYVQPLPTSDRNTGFLQYDDTCKLYYVNVWYAEK